MDGGGSRTEGSNRKVREAVSEVHIQEGTAKTKGYLLFIMYAYICMCILEHVVYMNNTYVEMNETLC